MLKSKVAAGLLAGLFCASSSQASVVSYFLDQSNQLADGVNYLMVTISDEREEGVIDFSVEALQPLLDLAGDNFGIQSFAFNVLAGVSTEARNVDLLPKKWRARNGGRMDGFGLYDITLQAKAQGRSNGHGDHEGHGDRWGFWGYGDHGDQSRRMNVQDPLTFSIIGVDFDTIQSYVELSRGFAPEGFSLFSAAVTGLDLGNCGGGDRRGPLGSSRGSDDGDHDGDHGGGGHGGGCMTTAYFGGNTNAVPAPPAFWLLGTAVAGLVVRRFRSARTS